MSAAMVNVGLMWESRFRIRSVTRYAYACGAVVATRGPGEPAQTAQSARVPFSTNRRRSDHHTLAATAVEISRQSPISKPRVESARERPTVFHRIGGGRLG